MAVGGLCPFSVFSYIAYYWLEFIGLSDSHKTKPKKGLVIK